MLSQNLYVNDFKIAIFKPEGQTKVFKGKKEHKSVKIKIYLNTNDGV